MPEKHKSHMLNRRVKENEENLCACTENLFFRSNKMPEEWRRSILVPIFKNKGDVQSCTNYRGIKLMSHTMKLWERVIEHRLRRKCDLKPIWVHACKVNHGGDFLNTTIDGEI